MLLGLGVVLLMGGRRRASLALWSGRALLDGDTLTLDAGACLCGGRAGLHGAA